MPIIALLEKEQVPAQGPPPGTPLFPFWEGQLPGFLLSLPREAPETLAEGLTSRICWGNLVSARMCSCSGLVCVCVSKIFTHSLSVCMPTSMIGVSECVSGMCKGVNVCVAEVWACLLCECAFQLELRVYLCGSGRASKGTPGGGGGKVVRLVFVNVYVCMCK